MEACRLTVAILIVIATSAGCAGRPSPTPTATGCNSNSECIATQPPALHRRSATRMPTLVSMYLRASHPTFAPLRDSAAPQIVPESSAVLMDATGSAAHAPRSPHACPLDSAVHRIVPESSAVLMDAAGSAAHAPRPPHVCPLDSAVHRIVRASNAVRMDAVVRAAIVCRGRSARMVPASIVVQKARSNAVQTGHRFAAPVGGKNSLARVLGFAGMASV
jgi:hypothetical protein